MIKIDSFIRNSGGLFFTVVFRKKDGTIRRLNGRTGVWKHTKSGSIKNENRSYFVVYDVKAAAYRSIRKDAIVAITCEGVTVLNNVLPDTVA